MERLVGRAARVVGSQWATLRRRRGGRRTGWAAGLAGPERLEVKTPLAVDVSLSDSILTLTYAGDADASVLAVDDDGNYAVTGLRDTVITGSAASGNFFDDVWAVAVVNASGGRQQVFNFTSSTFIGLLEAPGSPFALAIGSSTNPIATVDVSTADSIDVNGQVAIYAGDVSITGGISGPGENLVITATGTVTIDSIDEFSGTIAISCLSFAMSGSLLNDGWSESGPLPDSGGLAAGDGFPITIDATGSISIAGSVSSNGGGMLATASGAGYARAGNGGTITMQAGSSLSLGGLSVAGGSEP